MPKVNIKNTFIDVDITSDNYLGYDNQEMLELLKMYKVMNSIVPLARIDCKKTGSDYDYKITARDGRVWEQTFNITPGQEPKMTFNVDSEWKLSEFSLGREPRNKLITLIEKYGITDFTCKYLP